MLDIIQIVQEHMSIIIIVFINHFIQAALAKIFMQDGYMFVLCIHVLSLWHEEAVLSVVDTLSLLHLGWTKLTIESLNPWYKLSMILKGVLVLIKTQNQIFVEV